MGRGEYRRISTMSEAIEALAEAWASLDGKLDEFLSGRGGEDTEGDYHGYLSDAAELAKRLEHRGYRIVRIERGHTVVIAGDTFAIDDAGARATPASKSHVRAANISKANACAAS